jgi:hypothetical protein
MESDSAFVFLGDNAVLADDVAATQGHQRFAVKELNARLCL